MYSDDIMNAREDVLIVSPFLTKMRVKQALQYISASISKNIKVTVITRPPEDFTGRNTSTSRQTIDILKNAGVSLLLKSNIHQKFAIIDHRIVWYGSINLLSYGGAEESIMRLESFNIANELTRTMEY